MKGGNKNFTVVLIYVDDIIVIENDLKTVETLKLALDKNFKIKDLRDLKYFLGIKVAKSSGIIYIC